MVKSLRLSASLEAPKIENFSLPDSWQPSLPALTHWLTEVKLALDIDRTEGPTSY